MRPWRHNKIMVFFLTLFLSLFTSMSHGSRRVHLERANPESLPNKVDPCTFELGDVVILSLSNALKTLPQPNEVYLGLERLSRKLFDESILGQKPTVHPINIGKFNEALYLDRGFDLSHVAVHNGRLIGFALGYPERDRVDDQWRARLYKLGVDDAYQGRGVSSRLVNQFALRALHFGLTRTELWVLKENDHAQSIYKKWGYVNTLPDEYHNEPLIYYYVYAARTKDVERATRGH